MGQTSGRAKGAHRTRLTLLGTQSGGEQAAVGMLKTSTPVMLMAFLFTIFEIYSSSQALVCIQKEDWKWPPFVCQARLFSERPLPRQCLDHSMASRTFPACTTLEQHCFHRCRAVELPWDKGKSQQCGDSSLPVLSSTAARPLPPSSVSCLSSASQSSSPPVFNALNFCAPPPPRVKHVPQCTSPTVLLLWPPKCWE